ncbi:uncharacterized protein LOC112685701 isoform X2 [Sipha flava]|uniref:Uncharacterized protein LOC112685701 isoform X2 n=1 Tax=Sipha flava TaxID=143950 RepID=A0A8B8FR55_9HEMI|nr:uncharacterized protein LOC112685701 isoform X2 [Sipha flava]
MRIIVIACVLFVCGIVDANLNEQLGSNVLPSSNQVDDLSKPAVPKPFGTNQNLNYKQKMIDLALQGKFMVGLPMFKEIFSSTKDQNMDTKYPKTNLLSENISTEFNDVGDKLLEYVASKYIKKYSKVPTTEFTESQTERVTLNPETLLLEDFISHSKYPSTFVTLIFNKYKNLLTTKSTETQTEKVSMIPETFSLEDVDIDLKHPNTIFFENLSTEFNNNVDNSVDYVVSQYIKKYLNARTTESIESEALKVDNNEPYKLPVDSQLDNMNYVLEPSKSTETTVNNDLAFIEIVDNDTFDPETLLLEDENIDSEYPNTVISENISTKFNNNVDKLVEYIAFQYIKKYLNARTKESIEPEAIKVNNNEPNSEFAPYKLPVDPRKSTKVVGDRIEVETSVANDNQVKFKSIPKTLIDIIYIFD